MGQSYKLIGAPCAHRGPYTFYKAFKYTKNNISNILTINEFFFVKLWNDSDLISIGELRLLWEDKNCDQTLASLRLYILPENTPDGRISDVHGEDEVLAITEKVVVRLEDLLTWITEATDWSWGLAAIWRKECTRTNKVSPSNGIEQVNGSVEKGPDDGELDDERCSTLMDCSAIDYSEIHEEKMQLDKTNWEVRTGVVVLSYSMYCRYRGLLKRLEGVHNEWLRNQLITALGGFTASCRTTKILFCKDTFDYPELEGHELLCNHLAPKLRSRIPKKKKSLYPSPDASESDSSSSYSSEDDNEEGRLSSSASSSVSTHSRASYAASRSSLNVQKQPYPKALSLDDAVQITAVDEQKKQKAFTQNLYAFMRARLTPIGKLPYIGSREMNLFEFYNRVKHLGGYAIITNHKMWKCVFGELDGDNGSAAATATIIRKHYERYLLPYELHMAQQFKPTPSHNQILSKQSSSGIHKSLNLTINPAGYDSRKPIMTSLKPSQSMNNKVTANSKPSDKENIPLKKSSGCSSSDVIDLCGASEASRTAASQQRASSSVVTEVIDLCDDSSPIKRSVPSIAATLFPKKRKLDILREGGLEVTPISSSFLGANEPDVVTITKTITIDSDGEAYSSSNEGASIEILNPRKYTSACSSSAVGCLCTDNHECNGRDARSKPASQVLDLSTMKSNGRVQNDNYIMKKIGPSLGPNIEISLVPNDDMQRDSKKRKSVPALRKISTGEFSARNLSMKAPSNNETHKYKPHMSIKSAHSRNAELAGLSMKDLKPSVSITATENSPNMALTAQPGTTELSAYPPNINQSLYIAALYKSMLPQVSNNDDVSNVYQHHLSFLADSFLQQQQQQQELNNKASVERFAKILMNNSVSIDDCEQVPD